MDAPSASTCLILKQHRRLRSLEQIIAERKQNGTGDLRSRKPHFHTHIHRHRSCSSSVCRFAATVTCACADWRCAATNIDDKLTLSSSQREWCLSFFALFFTAKNLISMSPECAGNPGDSVRIPVIQSESTQLVFSFLQTPNSSRRLILSQAISRRRPTSGLTTSEEVGRVKRKGCGVVKGAQNTARLRSHSRWSLQELVWAIFSYSRNCEGSGGNRLVEGWWPILQVVGAYVRPYVHDYGGSNSSDVYWEGKWVMITVMMRFHGK